MAELSTAIRIQQEALAAKGIALSVEQAHEAWAEHSDDYCAGWLCWRDENPRGEILEALTKYEARHGALKRVDLAKTRVVNPVTGKQVNT